MAKSLKHQTIKAKVRIAPGKIINSRFILKERVGVGRRKLELVNLREGETQILLCTGIIITRKMNQMVYGLYGLTPEEIQIVENSVK